MIVNFLWGYRYEARSFYNSEGPALKNNTKSIILVAFPMSPDMAGKRDGQGTEMTQTAVDAEVAHVAFYWKCYRNYDLVHTLVETRQHSARLPSME